MTTATIRVSKLGSGWVWGLQRDDDNRLIHYVFLSHPSPASAFLEWEKTHGAHITNIKLGVVPSIEVSDRL